MKIIIEDFIDSVFLYEGKKHIVEFAKVINGIAKIKTDHKTFVKTASELAEFYEDVKFVPVVQSSLPEVKKALAAEIIQANTLAGRLTSKLETVFDELSGKPSEETYKKAKGMVDTSNAIMNIMAQNYKYLNLNK